MHGNFVRQIFEKPTTRAAIALYILMVAVVYYTLLAHLEEHQGWSEVTNTMMHAVLPAQELD